MPNSVVSRPSSVFSPGRTERGPFGTVVFHQRACRSSGFALRYPEHVWVLTIDRESLDIPMSAHGIGDKILKNKYVNTNKYSNGLQL